MQLRCKVAVLAVTSVLVGSLALGSSSNQLLTNREKSAIAARRAIPLMQHSAEYWFKSRECTSCHHQLLSSVALAVGKERGFSFDSTRYRHGFKKLFERESKSKLRRLEGSGSVNGSSVFSFEGWALAASGYGPSDNTDATSILLLQKQSKSGRWPSYSHRPPIEDSSFTSTAMAIKFFKNYGPSPLRREVHSATQRALTWLETAVPNSNEDSTMQIMGLVWGNAPKDLIAKHVAALIAAQKPDGGWAQTAARSSDSYATGQALIALFMSGTSTDSKVYQAGIDYLLRTQKPDGSWLVTTRRVDPGLAYFETGFPYGKHQFISFAGTAWATMALEINARPAPSFALTDTTWRGDNLYRGRLARDTRSNELLQAALWGSLDDMKKAVAKGANVDSRSYSGGTALLYAARSPSKVAWLVANGANVNAKSDIGLTPFLLASEFTGSDQPFKIMVGSHPDLTYAGTLDELTPVSMAASTGHLQRLLHLVDALKAPVGEAQIGFAYTCGEYDAMDILAKRAPDIDKPLDEYGNRVLYWAVGDGSTEGVRRILELGADPNICRNNGTSPLMLAAMRDSGAEEMISLLLSHGANPLFRNLQGKTAMTLARKYGNKGVVSILEKAIAQLPR